MQRIRCQQFVPCGVPNIGRYPVAMVRFATGLHPLQINQSRGEILRSVALNLAVFTGDERAKSSPAMAAAVERKREKLEVIDSGTASGEKRANIFRQPERAKDIDKRLVKAPGEIALRNDHRNVFRQAVLPPHI